MHDNHELSDTDLEGVAAGLGKSARNSGGTSSGSSYSEKRTSSYSSTTRSGSYGSRPAQAPRVRSASRCGPNGCS